MRNSQTDINNYQADRNHSKSCPTRFEWIVLAIIASIAVITLLVPPIVGLADNGDFYKMMSKFGLEHEVSAREDRYFNYVDTIYVPDPAGAARYQEVWGRTLISSEIIFVAAAVWLNRLLGLGPTFHLQILGFTHILVLVLGAYLLLLGTRSVNRGKRVTGIVFSVIMFVDVAYTSYFNSAYTETAGYIFLVLLIAAVTHIVLQRRLTPLWILFYFIFSVSFCCSRYPNVVMYPLLAVYGILIAISTSKMANAVVALCGTIAGGYLCLLFVHGIPPAYTEFSLYNHFFNALLRFSPAPDKDVKEFGLSPESLTYRNTTYFQPQSGAYNSEVIRSFRENVTTVKVMRFYMHHPTRAWDAISRGISHGLTLRQGYGNYEKKAGRPPGAISQGFAIWSSLRETILPKLIWAVVIVLWGAILFAFWPRRSLCGTGFRILIVLLCALQLGMTSCASDPTDIIRHMFLFNLLFDVTLLITVIELVSYFGERIVRSEVVEETN